MPRSTSHQAQSVERQLTLSLYSSSVTLFSTPANHLVSSLKPPNNGTYCLSVIDLKLLKRFKCSLGGYWLSKEFSLKDFALKDSLHSFSLKYSLHLKMDPQNSNCFLLITHNL